MIDFSNYPREAIISKKELALLFNKSPLSVDRAVRRGELPPPIRILNRDSWVVGILIDFFSGELLHKYGNSIEEQKRLRVV